MHRRFELCFLAHFKNQTTRRTGDELGFIVQHKINQVFEYSNNNSENFKQLSLTSHVAGRKRFSPLDG